MAMSDIYALTPEQAYFALEHARWHGHPQCPYCQSITKIWEHKDRRRRAPRLQCGACLKAFCGTVGTMFHKSQIPMRTWFLAIAHLAHQPDVSAAEFGGLVGINRRATAAKMKGAIRSAYRVSPPDRKLIEN